MLDNDENDNIIFNKEKIPKIITITKERALDNAPNSVIILNTGKNKIHLNLDKNSQKINREEIMNSLKEIKRIEFENLDDYYDTKKIDILPYKSIKTSQNKLIKIVNKDKININKFLDNNAKLDIYDKELNIDKFKMMKNKLLKKDKEEILIEENDNKFNTTELFQKNMVTNRYSNKHSDRISLQSSNSNNFNSISNSNDEYDYYNKNNFTETKKRNNEDLDKKMNFKKNKKEFTRNKTLSQDLDKMNSTNLITNIVSMINNTKSLSDKTNSNSPYDKCLICERKFSIMNLCCSECNIHFFCRKCLKFYCRDLIEKGIKKMKCPITNCKYEIYVQFLKSVLSKDYFQILLKRSQTLKNERTIINVDDLSRNKYRMFNKKIKNNSVDNTNNIRLYSNKHVIDVNSNILLYKVRKYKDEYCPNCHEPTLFCKIDAIFHKCLNCGFKVCKYCNKEYTKTHLMLNYPEHCKVYYKKKVGNKIKVNYFNDFLIQLIYTISMYYISYAFCYLRIFTFFNEILKIRKNNTNKAFLLIFFRIKDIFNILISFVFFIMIFPFLFIWTPFFPVVISLVDGF